LLYVVAPEGSLVPCINAQCMYALRLIQRKLYPCLPAQGMQWVQADCH
jgi:hypothetical protein